MMTGNFFNLSKIIPLSNRVKEINDYLTDMRQRSLLFLDVLRKRGNEMVAMTGNNSSTVLNFKFEQIMDGADFEQPEFKCETH